MTVSELHQNLNILHLEDNFRDAELIRESLSEAVACEIFRVDNREAFVKAIASKKFDLILSDYSLPSFDGLSALTYAQETCPEIPFIFVSGNIGEESAIESLKRGATDYILKDRLLRLVTSVKRALREVELRREHKQLEERLRQSQKMEAIGQLAGGVAHDFNNLLTVINGYSEILASKIDRDHELWFNLNEILKAGKRASSLTRQLLAFSRRQVIQPKVLSLNELILDMNNMLRRLIPETIELLVIPGDQLPLVKVDPGQIQQVIMNLLVNAVDAIEKAGKIIIETKHLHLTEAYTDSNENLAPGHYVLLVVSDTGTGIKDEIKTRIFEPFFTTKETKGTGLGLATSFGIVRQNGGHMTVYSEWGHGSAFKVYLPAMTSEHMKEEWSQNEPEISLKSPQGSETILFVEDDDAIRNLSVMILAREGYLILQASDGEEAVKLIESHKGKTIHLICSDIVMPKLSGKELVDKIRKHDPKMKVLFTSGYTDNVIVRQEIMDASVDFINKPYTPRELLFKIREVLDKR